MDTVQVHEGNPATTGARDDVAGALAAHGSVLLATARVITMDADEAQDLVQVTFEIAIRQGTQLRNPAALRAWLLKIEVREAFRVVRRLRRLVALDGHVTDLTTPTPDLAQQADVRDAMGRLPKRIRAAIALHHMAGLSVAETAVAMGTSENTVKSQLRTGLARLREDLGDG
jgi:RNA polymerase sigma-70 factor, ECF subfamily